MNKSPFGGGRADPGKRAASDAQALFRNLGISSDEARQHVLTQGQVALPDHYGQEAEGPPEEPSRSFEVRLAGHSRWEDQSGSDDA